MQVKRLFFPFLALAIFISACHEQRQVQNFQTGNYKLKPDTNLVADDKANKIIQPYKKMIDSLMNIHIIDATQELKKDLPEGSLGNMVCDVSMKWAIKQGKHPDFCVMNNGGLRIPTIYQGPVFVRTIYELMPFDNQFVLLKLSGKKCLELFQAIAKAGGTPESGFRMAIQNEMPVDIQIGSKPFDENNSYWVLTSDYMANGGDKSDFFQNPIERVDLNVLIRTALVTQLKDMFYDGETLQAIKDGRISKR